MRNAKPGILLLALLSCLGAAFAEPLRPQAILRPERGFLDDAFALAPDGSALTYVVTDGATFVELRRAPMGPEGGALRHELAVPGLPLLTSAVLLLPDDRVLVIVTDDSGQKRSGTVYSLRRRAALPQRIGPADDIVLGTAAGQPAVLALTAPGPEGGEYRLQAVHAGTWRPLGDRRYRVSGGPGGLMQGGAAAGTQPLYLTDGYLTLVGKQSGDYDRKNDIRQPDRLVLLDLLGGRLHKGAPIGDPTALAADAQLAAGHGATPAFVSLDEGRGRLELVRHSGGVVQRTPLTMPRPLPVYDAATLRYAPRGPEMLLSLTVDPVNEAAVKRQKRDPDTLDLCAVPLAGGELRRLGEIPGGGRPSSWVAAGEVLALLRKHRGFSRGGTEIEIYRIAGQPGGGAPAQVEARR